MKILIVTGGSGGHVIPAGVLYKYFKDKNYSTDFAVDTRGTRYLNFTPSYHWNSYHSHWFWRYWNIFKFFFKSFNVVRKYDTIISFGTYHSIPFLISAIILRKKIYLHEQNITLSRVNKTFFKWANNLIISWHINETFSSSMDENFQKFSIPLNNPKVKYLGMPIRSHKKHIIKNFKILVCFGSQEAPLLNPLLNKLLDGLPTEIQSQITVLSASNNFKKDKKLLIKQKSFITSFDKITLDGKSYEIMDLYDTCSLAIGRGGAGFLYETIALKKPFITIPIHYSIKNHQFYNSKYAVKNANGFLLWNDKDIPGAQDFIIKVFNKETQPKGEVILNSCQLIDDLIHN